MLLTDKRAWLFSAKLYVAAVATLGISLLGGLERPYWAMSTVYIVSQPLLGMTRARGVYRILGTLLACAAVVWLMNYVQTPLLMSLMLSVWMSGCLFIALLHRGPSGYVFLLASYTAVFIGLQTVATPELIFDVAVARGEEIILGALCAVLAASLLFPASAKPAINSSIASWLDDAAAWAREVLTGKREGSRSARRALLASDLSQFEALITMARYEDARHPQAHVQMQELRMRMLSLLPVLGWIDDRLGGLRTRKLLTPVQASLLDALAAWLDATGAPDAQRVAGLRARIAALRTDPSAELANLVSNSLLLRLDELVELWSDCRTLQDDITRGAGTSGERRFFRIDLSRMSVLGQRHIDFPMVAFAAASAGVSLMGYCVLWILVGWPGGAFGAMLGAVVSAFYASQDDPAPNMLRMLVATVLSLVLVAIYQFGVLPAVHDFGSLVLVLAPVFLVLGLLIYNPRTMGLALPMTANLATLLNLRSTFDSDFQGFVNTSVSIVLGVGFAILVTRLFRSVGAEWSARRLVRHAWTVIADAAAGHGVQDRELFTARMLDLLGQLAPRIAAVSATSGLATVDLLDEIRVGLNVMELRRARRVLPAANAASVDLLLEQLSAYYRQQAAHGHKLPAPEPLRQALDASLTRVRTLSPGQGRDEALLGLVGLRHAFGDGAADPGRLAAAPA